MTRRYSLLRRLHTKSRRPQKRWSALPTALRRGSSHFV